MIDTMEIYQEFVRENISYECFAGRGRGEQEDVDELVELIVETMILPDHGTVRIAGVDKPVTVVKS